MAKSRYQEEVSSTSVDVNLSLFVPGHKPVTNKVSIPSAKGKTLPKYLTPDAITELMVEGLKAKFGRKVEWRRS